MKQVGAKVGVLTCPGPKLTPNLRVCTCKMPRSNRTASALSPAAPTAVRACRPQAVLVRLHTARVLRPERDRELEPQLDQAREALLRACLHVAQNTQAATRGTGGSGGHAASTDLTNP